MEERRNDVEIRVVAERVDNLKSQLEESDRTSNEWRGRFCRKLDDVQVKIDHIVHKLDTLPCPQRIEATKGIHTQLKALWAVTGGMVIAILSEWVKLK